jgi:pyridoxal/pyridoxine/pyridoxamine kinase
MASAIRPRPLFCGAKAMLCGRFRCSSSPTSSANRPFAAAMSGLSEPRDLIQSLTELGCLDDFDMLLTSNWGTRDTTRLAAELAGIIREQKPNAIFACDPVMGEDDVLHGKPDLTETMTSGLVPIANVLL